MQIIGCGCAELVALSGCSSVHRHGGSDQTPFAGSTMTEAASFEPRGTCPADFAPAALHRTQSMADPFTLSCVQHGVMISVVAQPALTVHTRTKNSALPDRVGVASFILI